MSDKPASPLPVFLKIANGMNGSAVWSSRVGVGSMLKVDFGARVQILPGRPLLRGEWRLAVDDASWRVEHGGEIIGGSGDEADTMSRAAAVLCGRRLVKASLLSPFFDAVFWFSGRSCLRVFASQSGSEPRWKLFYPPRHVLIAKKTWVVRDADEVRRAVS